MHARSRLAGTFLVLSESDSEPWDPDSNSKSIPIAHTSIVLVVLSVYSTSLTMIQVSKAM